MYNQSITKGSLPTIHITTQLNTTTRSTSTLLFRRFNSTETRETIQEVKNGDSDGDLPSGKIVSIINEITQLTLLETSDLINHLQKTLNLPSISGSVGMMNPINDG